MNVFLHERRVNMNSTFIKLFVFYITAVAILSSCSGSRCSTLKSPSIESLTIEDIKGCWFLVEGFERDVVIDRCGVISSYTLPEELDVEAVLMHDDGELTLDDWGVIVEGLTVEQGTNVTVEHDRVLFGSLGKMLAVRYEGKILVLEFFMVVTDKKNPLEWTKIAQYSKS